MDQQDAALLAAVCEGSERAFNVLVDRHQQAVRLFLRRVVGANDADDVAQDTFVALWTQAQTFRGGSAVRTWLLGIAWRKAKDLQRSGFRRARRDTGWHQGAVEWHAAAAPDTPVEAQHMLERAMQSLSLDQRAAIMLCLAYEFSHAEAAEALGMPLGTVKSHVARGRVRLREVLGE